LNEALVRSISAGLIAALAVGGGILFAILALQHGQSPEPPAWMSILIGGAVTYLYASNSHMNGQTAALTSIASTIAQRRAIEPPGPVPVIVVPPA
jgi:hypothetical protein